MQVPFVEGAPESFLTIKIFLLAEGGINGKQGDQERFCGKLQDSNPRRERDEIVHQWEQMLKDCKSNSCMWVIRIPRQIKVPV